MCRHSPREFALPKDPAFTVDTLKRLLCHSLAVFALGSCAEPVAQVYEIGSARYVFPKDHVIIARREPTVFLRLSPPSKQFTLVFDSKTSQLEGESGLPFIFSVSNAPIGALRATQISDSLVVCRTGSVPVGSCGASVRVRGANWSVLIPPARLSEAPSIVREARAALETYRVE